MPVVDKLPALLREDLESAFSDDMDNVFNISNLRQSLGQRKRDTEIDLKRVLFQIYLISFTNVNLDMLLFQFMCYKEW